MYMFPRQFGLHNVLTSQVDHTQTAQKFQDYTLREEEIARKFCTPGEGTQQLKARVPKRLRGLPQHLVEKLQVLHDRCSYSKLLEHYCPVSQYLLAHSVWWSANSRIGPSSEQTPNTYIARYTEADEISEEVATSASSRSAASVLVAGRVSFTSSQRVFLLSSRTGKDHPERPLG